MIEENTSDQKGLKVIHLVVVSIVGFIIPLGLWTVGYFNICTANNIYSYFKDLPDFIEKISPFLAALFGLEVVISGVFTKGTPWYPKKHGKRKLKNILSKYKFIKSPYEYAELKDFIDMLNQPKDDFNNQYYQCVYILQETSTDFKMVWNDFNFYNSIIAPSKEEINYLNQVRQYIYKEIKTLYSNMHEKQD